MSESSQFEFAPCCKTDPQSPIVDSFASCNRPRQISKEGHLKSTSKPWMVEQERKTENLKEKYSYHPVANGSLTKMGLYFHEGSIYNTSALSPNVLNPITNNNNKIHVPVLQG